MIRPTEPGDTPALLEIARGTGVFRAAEIDVLREGLDDYHDGERDEGHVAVTYLHENLPAGLAYHAPAPMTDRAWYLWWIIVARPLHARGIGAALLRSAEEQISDRGGRLVLIETSSLSHFEAPRRFYLRNQYAPTATIPDYYADGDDLVVFAKRLRPLDPATP